MSESRLPVFQKGFNYSQDGPGNRLVLHLQGCNLHCPWCSNPESMAHSEGGMTVDEAVDLCLSSVPMMFDGGGVTLTGGEPTIHFEAVMEFAEKLKASGINTCMETNATHKHLTELSNLIDFMICDLKHYDPEKLEKATGCGNETVLDNLKALSEIRSQLLVRIPLIHGFNSSAKDAEGFVAALSPFWKDHARLEVLRYHEYGKDKWKKLGMPYIMRDAFVSDNEYDLFCSLLADGGMKLVGT